MAGRCRTEGAVEDRGPSRGPVFASSVALRRLSGSVRQPVLGQRRLCERRDTPASAQVPRMPQCGAVIAALWARSGHTHNTVRKTMLDKQLASSREQARRDEIEGFRPWQSALSKPLRVTLANGPAGCRGGFETGLPNVTFETHKKELGDSS